MRMRDVLFPDLHVVHLGYWDGFVRGDTQNPGGHLRFQLERGRQCRIDDVICAPVSRRKGYGPAWLMETSTILRYCAT